MIEKQKPLHVLVAEVIGWTGVSDIGINWHGAEPGGHPGAGWRMVLRYDTDWAATGPLIERFNIALGWNGTRWVAQAWAIDGEGSGETALVAVCNLILALHAAGKLPRSAA